MGDGPPAPTWTQPSDEDLEIDYAHSAGNDAHAQWKDLIYDEEATPDDIMRALKEEIGRNLRPIGVSIEQTDKDTWI